jgi:PAS domain S-box-containing protein
VKKNVALRLMIVEHHEEDAELLVAELVRAGFTPDWFRVDTLDDLVEGLYPAPDVILCNHATPGLDALDVLSTLRRLRSEPPVIVVCGELDEEICVKTLRMGAADYLLKDRLARLGPAVEHALVLRRLTVEKREAERKERETASILRGLVAHAPAAISVKSVDGSYLLANRQFETLRGVRPGTLIGRIDADVFPVDQAREMTELDARCLQDSQVMEREEELVEPSGRRNVLGVRYPVIDETGEVFGIGAIYLDITRQKRVEAQLRQTRAEVLSRAEMLAAGIEQLRELDRLKTEFVDAVSHELRTPLTSIRGYLELLRDGDVNLAEDLARRCLDVIDRNSEHLMSLVEDLLILSRVDSGTFCPPDGSVSVPAVVSSAVSILRPSVQQAGLSLSVNLDDTVPRVTGDRDQLERVVMNLLSNAVKFSPDRTGPIEVSVTSADGSVSVVIADHGIGIAEPEQQQVFTRFFRSAAARDRGIPGSGLGLAVVKGIVDGHGGTVSATSTPGRGTTMVVRLPATV